MITRIDSIREFGSYKSFTWGNSHGIKDFNKKNLFYGWNYSGKTTLSRIFTSLRDKTLDNNYDKGYFKIKTESGDFESSNMELFPYSILVFNSDYIKENLGFSFHKDSISESKTILFEVGDNAKFQTKIDELKNQIDLINGTELIEGKKIKYLKAIYEFDEYDRPTSGKFTTLAREIKDEHFISLINFTKANLRPILSTVKGELAKHIITDKKRISQLSAIVQTSEPKLELDEIQIVLSYSNILEATNQILTNIPDKNIIDKILDRNSEIYSWVKKGIELNNANEKCLFCNNTIEADRMKYLNEYFNSQASSLKEKTESLKLLIRQEEINIENINLPSSFNDFNLGFTDEYIALKKKYDKFLDLYKSHLKQILIKLDNKINKSLYLKIEEIIPFKIDNLKKAITDINELIKNNNDFTKGFQHRIETERTLYKNHLVASFLKREKYIIKEKLNQKAVDEIEKLDTKVEELEKEVQVYESKKVSDEEGASQYTYFIQSFLNRTDIEIKVDNTTKKFLLLRNKENASNLSEGEKTAIAFSHFLVSIKALQIKGTFKDYIIFVDDPISSLDGNHIFQINSLLKETFFFKDVDGENKIKCKQVFFSSHNFEFFNLLKELPLSKNKESRYFIERNILTNASTVKALPEIFDKYASEYHFLFKEIFDFNKLRKPLNSEKLLIIPNILRRFLEMYTLTKYPSIDPVDRRADKIFSPEISKRICKPFHYFSHLDNIDRIGKQSEFMSDIPVACKSLIGYISKKDKLHYEALVNAVNS
jgi:wobble nucleotide-excising tRNase